MRGDAWVVGALLFALPGLASAHKGTVHRSLYLEATETHLVVLAHISVRGEERRKALVTVADTNKDGRLSESEQARLRDDLAAQALAGLLLFVDGERVALPDAQAKLHMPEGRPVEVAVHGQLELPAAAKQVVLQASKSAAGLDLFLLPGPRRLVSPRARPADKGIREAQLGPGDRIALEVSRGGGDGR